MFKEIVRPKYFCKFVPADSLIARDRKSRQDQRRPLRREFDLSAISAFQRHGAKHMQHITTR